MRVLFLIISFAILSKSYSQESKYQEAFNKYIKPFNDSLKDSKNIQIVEYLIHPQSLNKYFESQIDSLYKTDSTEFKDYYSVSLQGFLDSTPRFRIKKQVKRKNKVFFTWIHSNIIFAELIYGKEKRYNYTERPSFGPSYIFMFLIEENGIKLIKQSRLDYL